MRARALAFVICASSALAGAAAPGRASAQASAAEVDDDGGAAGATVRLACDGGLCKTATGSTCTVARGVSAARGNAWFASSLLALAWLASARFRRRRSRALASFTLVASVLASSHAAAAGSDAASVQPAADRERVIDVAIQEPKPPKRAFALEWNPLALLVVGKLSVNGVFVPGDHHALVISPFYAASSTVPIFVYDDAGQARQLPKQEFRGFGAELGYRYYSGDSGPRGFFVGPSLIFGSFTAQALNGTKLRFADLGLAADVGWQALVADEVAIGAGLGLQLMETSRSLPAQQFPARLYANRGPAPRFLLSIGWAF